MQANVNRFAFHSGPGAPLFLGLFAVSVLDGLGLFVAAAGGGIAQTSGAQEAQRRIMLACIITHLPLVQ